MPKVIVAVLIFIAGAIVGYLINEYFNLPPIDTIVLNGSDYNVAIPTSEKDYIVLLPEGIADSILAGQPYTITNASVPASQHKLYVKAQSSLKIKLLATGTVVPPPGSEMVDMVEIPPSQTVKFQYVPDPSGSNSHWEMVP